jgi:hypothetical protein
VIAIVAPAGELREAVASRLPADTRVTEPADPMTLTRALQGVERMFLACRDETAAADVVAAAEMAHVYLCVSLWPVDALTGSAVRAAVLLADPAEPYASSRSPSSRCAS